ncbi:MAG: ATP-binding protein [Bacillota bacterium]|nr:ATP-binding protein [Bacillota bacterium]
MIQDISGKPIPQALFKKTSKNSTEYEGITFEQIVGHSYAKRALEIAAAGGHHLFMTGPPGCGKSMLAESFPSILPPLSKDEWIEVMSIYQLSGTEPPPSMHAPYRNPHHSASGISIIGGGQSPKPGEISLAHRGVIFLDEIAEFNKKTLDMLRQPFESGKVTISRVRSTVTYPASFILLGAMNPCPCGYLHSPNHYCTCTPKQIASYQNRLSGPIRDRFDLFLTVKPVEFMSNDKGGNNTSKAVQERVKEARERQFHRYGQAICNSRVAYDTMMKAGQLTDEQNRSLQQFISKNQLSNRAHLKLIRLARTLADLENQSHISNENILEAIRLYGRKS